jgi:hypothetical protein
LSARCSQSWQAGDLVVVELSDRNTTRFVYGRFAGKRRNGRVGVYLDPWEARVLHFAPSQVHAFSAAMLAVVKEVPSTLLLFSHTHALLNSLSSNNRDQVQQLWSTIIFPIFNERLRIVRENFGIDFSSNIATFTTSITQQHRCDRSIILLSNIIYHCWSIFVKW